MFRWLTNMTLVAMAAGCAGAAQRYDGTAMLAPVGAGSDDRVRHVVECHNEARAGFRSGMALGTAEKAPLQGRSTEKYYIRGRPSVNRENNPSMYESLLSSLGQDGPAELSDRYVLCLLRRGYTWPNPSSNR